MCGRHQCAFAALPPASSQHAQIALALDTLESRNFELCFTRQNAGEFWNVSTRPKDRNGVGLTVEETRFLIRSIGQSMRLLSENEEVYRVWLRLLLKRKRRGVPVHDAHLAAVLEVHQGTHLLTLNGADFKRFPQIVAVHPHELAP